MVRKIQGKGKSASVNHFKKNNTHVTSKNDIANTLADNFSEKSSSEKYPAKLRRIIDQKKNKKLKSHQITQKAIIQNFHLQN